MTPLSRAIDEALEPTRLRPERFREIVLRLLETSVICHADSQAEAVLYNDASRIEALLVDYLSVIGCRLYHDRDFRYMRLYSPGATIPGLIDAEEAESGALRLRLNQHEVAGALILRFLYDKALQEGRMDDQGRTTISLEEFHTAMQTSLRRTLPAGSNERRALWRRLKQLKLIDYRTEDNLEDAESFLVIRPMITSFVHPDLIEAAGGDDRHETTDTQEEDGDVRN